jgi:hypothetical protein
MKIKHNIIVNYNKSSINPNFNFTYFDNIDTIEKAYWLGYLYADGYLNKNEHRIVLTTCEKDVEILYHFSDCLNMENTTIKKRIHKEGYISYNLVINSKYMYEKLINLGCHNNKSLKIRLPKLDTLNYYLGFLLGYYDGDGYSYSAIICSGSYLFLEDIKKYFNINFEIL